ncbi:MAG: PAS domain-containing protein [Pseudomonas sp.]|uniref:PAS domain-containing protein n=1 Tax=Stutzerimonas frequens TaxID=2968969 RepID=UPI0007B8F0BF|nr:PAS domain-containing protein [Stutzerimonas frequens]MBA4727458.1 PAS domain-containing protein [Pseudomonas sp.]MEC7472447.1 PAS domain-containing protein [Pseudomonadota bacterium]NCT78056.1 PAS domain-containing protein [Stutzerimonas stutzeri]KZX57223.1 hybrid sensor histidine kinase/response regulator [Stutzerimonas frequens]QFU13941.1 Blue-light-activated protein [Stutzerimonas frequens]|tara:strand:+ start:3858 stop:5990 length:2133 start_codon:yes stop_codon:yes gene_type:complete
MQQRPSFESLFRLSPNAYVLLDRDLVILDANAAYLALTGRRLEEIQGQRLHEAFAADPLSPETTRVQELLDSFARVLSRKAVDTLPVIRYSIARHTPLGPVYEDRYWSATHTPVLGEQGEVVAILQHTSDITELQAMKDSLKQVAGHQPVQQLEQGVMSRARLLQSEGEQLRRLFAQAPGFVCFLRGPNHVYELVNDAYREVTGHRQLLGKAVREGLPEVVDQGLIDLLDEVYRTGRSYIGKRVSLFLKRQADREPEETILDFVLQPIIENEGNVTGIFVQGQDVTEQQRNETELQRYREHLEELVRERTQALEQSEAERQVAEQALQQAQRLEAVGKLTGGIAHDFNNMLQIIGGNLQLLRRSLGNDETAARRLNSAVSGVEKGARLASQLLAFASRQPLLPRQVYLPDLLEQMHELLDGALGSAVQVDLDVVGRPWPVFVDVGNLQSVVLNLAANARDAMAGRGRLVLRLENRSLNDEAVEQPGDYVLLSVIDQGSGMSDEVRARAFEPFFTTKQENNASGLGLSMVYGFVKQSGGFVTLGSGDNGGTAVHVHLPRSAGENAESDAASEREPALPEADGSSAVDDAGLRILFVEDDPTLRMLTGEVLTELGHRVEVSETAEEALGFLDRQPFDVLLTDVGLAGMSGIDLARQAGARHPELALVIASGYAVSPAEVGIDRLRTMIKPYDIHQVRELLDAIRSERAAASR